MSKHKKIFFISSTFLFVAIVGAVLFASLVKFGSANIPRIAYAIISVNYGNNDYVVVKDTMPKKVIIATPGGDYNFEDYAKSMGYEITEVFGSQFSIEKDDNKEFVYVTTNRYYSLWLWDD